MLSGAPDFDRHTDSRKTPRKQVAEAGLDTIDLTHWVHNNFGRWGLASAAESGALGAQSAPMDPDLVDIIEAWADLPYEVKAAIANLVGEISS